MRTDLKHYRLAGRVQSVQTTLIDTSTKSYRLRSGGREELEDFGNPSEGSPGSPLLWEALNFDDSGKLVEDMNLERPLIEQESYRYTYKYNQQGLLIERAGYARNGAFDERTEYRYGPGERKTDELIYSRDDRLQARYEFDEHGNFVLVEWYKEDGTIRQKVAHRYEYSNKGNTLEQNYYPPETPSGVGIGAYPPPGAADNNSLTPQNPPRYRTVFVRDDAGRLREETRYDVDGSLHEKKIWDQNGILRNKEWRVGDATVTTTLCDDQGREVEVYTIAKKGFLSPRAVDDHTLFSYDERGNLTSMLTSGPDGSLIRRTTNVFVYDSLGNWISKTETELTNTWKTEPFPAAFETIRQFHRTISYFPE